MDTLVANSKLVSNQHYDESVDVNDAEEVASTRGSSPATEKPLLTNQAMETMSVLSDAEVSASERGSKEKKKTHSDGSKMHAGRDSSGQKSICEGDSEDTDSSSSDDNAEALTGSYDPTEYEHLTVSQEIKELFQYISRYTPQSIQLETKLKPFNPDYIPAVGDIDAFLKVPRPDNKPVSLGLTILDEPNVKQSDPTVLDLLLRSVSKTSGVRAMKVRSIQRAAQNPKAVDNWIESIKEMHRSKPPPCVHYSKSMPKIDPLMQEWPKEIEVLLAKISLPTTELDCSLLAYCDIVCSILDIPVYKNRIHSLHLLFDLYAAVKEFKAAHSQIPAETLLPEDANQMVIHHT